MKISDLILKLEEIQTLCGEDVFIDRPWLETILDYVPLQNPTPVDMGLLLKPRLMLVDK